MTTKKSKNCKSHRSAKQFAIGLLTASVLVACGSEENAEGKLLVDVSGLKVSVSDFRFGVQDVGSSTPQLIELQNVGVDTFPINSVVISGDHAQDFMAEAEEGVTLEPGDKFKINVSFEPVAEGQRVGSLDVDYSVIEGIGSNAVEALFYSAREIEDAGDNVAAAQEYRRYVDAGSTTDNKARALLKLTLLDEADIYGVGKDFNLYKSALNLRDDDDLFGAVDSLNTLIEEHSDSYLVDDAQYMLGYIQMFDEGDFASSLETMQVVIDNYPTSSYYDTALYSQGLAEYELGNIERAEEIFISLRDRHTGVQVDLFELQWPKDNYVSRLWFDRADEQLAAIDDEESAEESSEDS